MPITMSCPHCGCRQIVPDDRAGTDLDCPGCSRMLTGPPFDGWPAEDATAEAAAPVSAVAESPTTVNVHIHGYDYGGSSTGKSPATAAVLEVLFGVVFSVYGIGHIYAGNVGTGLFVMVLW